MKWLKNLFWKSGLGPLPANRGLPTPTRPAPPMPECKPPKQDISEPVITLLEELRKDVWEVKCNDSMHCRSYSVTHVFKESVVLRVMVGSYGDDYATYRLYCSDWMTMPEKLAVQEALKFVIEGQVALAAKLHLINSRNSFAKALGVTNEAP